jgi:hypothetical protein
VVAASNENDHRHADTFNWHRSWQDYLSSRGAWRSWQDACEEEVHREAVAGLHREHADFPDRFGGLFRSAFSRSRITETG